MNKRFVLVLFLATLLLSAIAVTPVRSANKVRIAVNIPLTGPIAAWSGQYPNGLILGIEDACRKKSIDPKIFAVDTQDNAGKPSQAVSILKKHEINGFDVYITVTTGAANAISGQVDRMGKPHFIASFDPFITQPAPTRMRIMANSKIEAPLLVKYAIEKKARKVYILALNFAYAEEQFGKIVQPALEKAGIKYVRERYNLEERNFKTIATKIKDEAPDLIILSGYSFHLQPMLRDLRVYGLVNAGKVVTSMDLVDLIDAGVSPDELQNVIFTCPLFDVPGKIANASDWRRRYEQRFKVKPSYVPAYAYDTGALIVNAYAKSGKVDVASLMAAIPFDGVSGKIALDSDRDIISTLTLAKIDKIGRVVEVK